MDKYVLGIDIGGTNIMMGAFSLEGALFGTYSFPTRSDHEKRHILQDLAIAAKKIVRVNDLDETGLQGVGVGVPGPIIASGTIGPCPNLGWTDANIQQDLSTLFSVPIAVDNDANMAALGEWWQGAGTGVHDLVVITLGTGIGAGVIIDGAIRHGATGSAGELGHMPVGLKDVGTCGCGKCGHLEQYASATGVIQLTRRELMRSDRPSILRSVSDLTCKNVFDAASMGDLIAIDVVSRVTDLLGRALATVSCILDPELIIVGGGMASAGDTLRDAIAKAYRLYAFPRTEQTSICLAELGPEAGIYGAALSAIRAIL